MTAPTPTPSLVPAPAFWPPVEVVKQTVIPPQHYICEDDIVTTAAIPFVIVVEKGTTDERPVERCI